MSKTFEVIERVGISTNNASEAIKEVVLEANSEKKSAGLKFLSKGEELLLKVKLSFRLK